MYIKNNYPNPIGQIYSTKAGNDTVNGRFNAFATDRKSDCRKAVLDNPGKVFLGRDRIRQPPYCQAT